MMELTLHHGPGSVCSQKVRLCLAEKGLAWEDRRPGRLGMRSPEYLSVNRDGVVPTLEHNGAVFVESRLINEYLDHAFPTPPLSPADPAQRWRMHWWTRQGDDDLHRATFALMFVISRRDAFIAKPRNTWRANLPGLNDSIKQAHTMELAERGFDSPWIADALRRYRLLVKDMEATLGQTPWLAGESFSLAECDIAPHLHRLEDLGLATLWRASPHVTRWLKNVRARPSFAEAITRWQSAEDADLMTRGAAAARGQLDALLAE